MRKLMFFMVAAFLVLFWGCEKEPLLLPNDLATMNLEDEGFSAGVTGMSTTTKSHYDKLCNYLFKLMDEGVLPGPNALGTMPYINWIERYLREGDFEAARLNLEGLEKHLIGLEAQGDLPTIHLVRLLGICEDLHGAMMGRTYLVDEDFECYPVGTYPWRGGWILENDGDNPMAQVVTDRMVLYGEKAFQMEGLASERARIYRPIADPPEEMFLIAHIRTNKMEPSVRFGTVAAVGFHDGRGNGNGHPYAYLLIDHNYQLFLKAKGKQKVFINNLRPNNWYRFKVQYNTDTRVANVWVNGQLFGTNIDLSGGDYPIIPTITLESGHDTYTQTYFDKVQLWTEERYPS